MTELKASAKTSPQKQREKRQFWRGLAGGAVVSCLLLAAGWVLYDRSQAANQDRSPSSIAEVDAARTQRNASAKPPTSIAATRLDPFADAVRIAERTSQASQTANSAAEWLELATQWQKASDLMGQVTASDSRYTTAQGRTVDYRNNSNIALQKARQVQSTSASPATAPDSSSGQL